MLEPGVLVGGDYRVERKLSEGGMGAVFVAEQVSTGAKRALKIVRPELLRNAKLRERFAQEAKVTSRIASDHIVSVVAAGYDEKLALPWLAMELLNGETLHDLVESRGPLPVDMALAILKQLAHAVDAAHDAQVVHRDLKPDNVFLATSRRSGFPLFVKVLDFGIARIVAEAQTANTESLGTPLWMAPEQAGSGDSVGPWTDVWAFGLIAFYLLTGKPYWLAAHSETSPLAVVREVCLDPLSPARERAMTVGFEGELPEAFDAWFFGCVTRDVKARYATTGEALKQLAAVYGVSMAESAQVLSSLPVKTRDTGRDGDDDDEAVDSRTRAAHAKTEIAPIPAPTPDSREAVSVSVSSREASSRAASAREVSSRVASSREAQETPAQAPPVSVTKPSLGVAPKSPWPKRAVVAALVAASALGVGLAVRARAAEKDRATCQASGDLATCKRACASGGGDEIACVREAEHGVLSSDAAWVSKSSDVLRGACAQGGKASAEACGALGHALAFPPPAGLSRDLKGAADALEKACRGGQMCAHAGALRDLGVAGFAKDTGAYFDAACMQSPASATEKLDCLVALAREGARNGEGHPGAPVQGRLASLPPDLAKQACAERAGDACAFVWLDPKADDAQVVAAYERGCEAGSALACNALGVARVAGGPGRAANPVLARETFERACNGGELAACNNAAFVLGGYPATVRRGPRGAVVYKLRCSGGIQVGCAGFGEKLEVLPKGTPVKPQDAVAMLDKACSSGLTTACVNLGAFVYLGRGVPRDRARAEKLFAESCLRGDASACGEQGTSLLAIRMDHPRDVRAGIGFLDRACKGGEEDSCTALYSQLLNGLPDSKRVAEGVAGLLRLGKKKIHSHVLVQLYETGAEGQPKDLVEARRVALAMCEGDAHCTDAAYFLSRGLGGPRDEVRATDLLAKGCDQDDYPSCTELGSRYREGRGQSKDPSRAVELFKRGCDGGDPPACDMLSRAYASAEGVPRDLARALTLARAACDSGGVEGCATVGVMIAEGKGAEKDIDAAMPYLSYACRRATQPACEKLQALGKPIPELDL